MTHVGEDLDGVLKSAEAVGLEGLHVEDVDTLDLTEELEALDTGGLLLAEDLSALFDRTAAVRGMVLPSGRLRTLQGLS